MKLKTETQIAILLLLQSMTTALLIYVTFENREAICEIKPTLEICDDN